MNIVGLASLRNSWIPPIMVAIVLSIGIRVALDSTQGMRHARLVEGLQSRRLIGVLNLATQQYRYVSKADPVVSPAVMVKLAENGTQVSRGEKPSFTVGSADG